MTTFHHFVHCKKTCLGRDTTRDEPWPKYAGPLAFKRSFGGGKVDEITRLRLKDPNNAIAGVPVLVLFRGFSHHKPEGSQGAVAPVEEPGRQTAVLSKGQAVPFRARVELGKQDTNSFKLADDELFDLTEFSSRLHVRACNFWKKRF